MAVDRYGEPVEDGVDGYHQRVQELKAELAKCRPPIDPRGRLVTVPPRPPGSPARTLPDYLRPLSYDEVYPDAKGGPPEDDPR